MIATLHRLFDNGKECIGRLYIALDDYEHFSCYIIERPYLDNKPNVSAIPPGQYELVWDQSPKYGRCLSVKGGTVSLAPSAEHKRFGIRVHIANVASDLEGCLGPGRTIDVIGGRIGVTHSGDTLAKLEAALDKHDHIPLHIYAPQGVQQ